MPLAPIVEVEWRPMMPDNMIGTVTLEFGDGTLQNRGQMTEPQARRLANEVFGGSATRLDVGAGVLKWIESRPE